MSARIFLTSARKVWSYYLNFMTLPASGMSTSPPVLRAIELSSPQHLATSQHSGQNLALALAPFISPTTMVDASSSMISVCSQVLVALMVTTLKRSGRSRTGLDLVWLSRGMVHERQPLTCTCMIQIVRKSWALVSTSCPA